MKYCAVKDCEQMVLDKEEQRKDKPFCFCHFKCREGRFSPPNEYTFTNDERILNKPLSNPELYENVSEEGSWNLETD